MILTYLLKIYFVFCLCIKVCNSSLIKTNYKLGLGLSKTSLNQLCKKLSDTKTPKICNIVSCIGANNWNQRYFVEKNFGIDPTNSSTLSGPLKPRTDLWELDNKNSCNLLLDSEIPNFENELRSNLDNSSFIKLSALSKCIYIFLNENDFDLTNEDIKLNANVKKFFEKLSKRIQIEVAGSDKKIKHVFIILPNFKTFQSKSKITKSNIDSLETEFNGYFNKNLYVKHYDDKLNVSSYLKSSSNLTVQEVVEVLKSFASPNTHVKSSLAYFRTKAFENLNKFVDDSLEKALNNANLNEFANAYRAQLLNSRINYYTLVMGLLGTNYPVNLFDVYNSHNVKLCLASLVKNLEKQIRLEFAKYYVNNSSKMDIRVAADQFIHKYKTGITSILPFNHSEFEILTESTASRLRQHMYYIDEIYRRFPNKSDSGRSAKDMKEIIKRFKGSKVSGIIQLVGVMKDKGPGNMRAFLNYKINSLPFLLTLGYSNDRDLTDDGSGTGAMAPRIRIQPRIHLNVNL